MRRSIKIKNKKMSVFLEARRFVSEERFGRGDAGGESYASHQGNGSGKGSFDGEGYCYGINFSNKPRK